MKTFAEKYDVIVVGAGHAGCEAALAAARMTCKVLVLAMNIDKIAHMPCNPAIGGIGKGQLVREIDALGGEMGKTIDATYIQIKTLNSSKGPAVQALRAQADKRQYSSLMKAKLLSETNIRLKQGEVADIRRAGEAKFLVATRNGDQYLASSVVVATGTFLKGEMVVGVRKAPGGRAGELPSTTLSGTLKRLGLKVGRFQSATPPRVLSKSLDVGKMYVQPGEKEPVSFSFFRNAKTKGRQRDCYLTHTNKTTHDIVNKYMHLSPIKSGTVSARGPRYCPSIDRKVLNFPEKDRHPVFVEPEGWDNDEFYLQGLTTSMPVEVQEKIVQSVAGLERAEIIRPGYAVAYDFIYPKQLKSTLECADIPGLFSAGQINGTSGYEEAAAQGLIAGINAARYCREGDPFVLDRSQAYIGVLIDDLVSKDIDEPYRMFTSRAEYRLVLRSDNAALRLAPLGHELGLITGDQLKAVADRARQIDHCLIKLEKTTIKGAALAELGINRKLTKAVGAKELLRRPDVRIEELSKFLRLGHLAKASLRQAEIEVKYEGYIRRQLEQIKAQKRLENALLPPLDYERIPALSWEARQKLAEFRPGSLGQASRIAGVSPADINVLMVYLHQKNGL